MKLHKTGVNIPNWDTMRQRGVNMGFSKMHLKSWVGSKPVKCFNFTTVSCRI